MTRPGSRTTGSGGPAGAAAFSRESRALLVVTLVASTALFAINPFLTVHLPRYAPGSGRIGLTLAVSAVVGSVAALLTSAATGDTYTRLLWGARWAVVGLTAGAAGLLCLPVLPVPARPVAAIAALVVLRASLNLYSNASRGLHLLTNGPSVDTGVLFAAIGTFFGIGSAVGPLLGGVLLGMRGLGAVLVAATALFAVCLLPLLPKRAGDVDAVSVHSATGPAPGLAARLWPSSRAAARICLGAGLAFVLYAQSLAYIPLTIAGHYPAGVTFTTAFFTANAVLLIAGSIPVMRVVQRRVPDDRLQIAVGIGCLLAALLTLRFLPAGWATLFVTVVLYTLGEILVPTVGMKLVKAEADRSGTRTARNIAFFSFATNTLGTGVGQYAGTAVAALNSPAWGATVWVAVGIMSTSVLWTRERPTSPVTAEEGPGAAASSQNVTIKEGAP